jgi:uncharacterized membrane protein
VDYEKIFNGTYSGFAILWLVTSLFGVFVFILFLIFLVKIWNACNDIYKIRVIMENGERKIDQDEA